MTRLLIDLSDVLDRTHPDDAVTVWAPTFREGARGQLIQPRRQKISLTDGKGEATVEPGPLMVQIYSPNARQKDATRLVIPDQPEVTLTAVMEEHFVYTPEVMGAIGAMREAALVSETNADLSATAAATSATAAATSSTAAATSETNAATSATTSDDAAATAVAALVAAEQEAQEAAAATAMQFIGTGFPNGVVAAPVGSIYTDTLATNGAVRWIKTTGTGNTGWQVEYGDTGWRDIGQTHLAAGWTLRDTNDRLMVRRMGGSVHVAVRIAVAETASFITAGRSVRQTLMTSLPAGFGQPFAFAYAESCRFRAQFVGLLTNGGVKDGLDANCSAMGGSWQAGDEVMGGASWPAPSNWPTTLPGTPA